MPADLASAKIILILCLLLFFKYVCSFLKKSLQLPYSYCLAFLIQHILSKGRL